MSDKLPTLTRGQAASHDDRTWASSRAGLALATLATAQFMVVLDSSIVNVALPSIHRGLHLTALDVLGRRRLSRRLRRAAAARRAPRGRLPSPGGVRRGPGRVRPGVRGLRTGRERLDAGRLAGRPGLRRRGDGAGCALPGADALPGPGRTCESARGVGRGVRRRRHRGGRPGRCAQRHRRLVVDLPDQRPGRGRCSAGGAVDGTSGPRRGRAVRRRRRAGLHPGPGRARLRVRQRLARGLDRWPDPGRIRRRHRLARRVRRDRAQGSPSPGAVEGVRASAPGNGEHGDVPRQRGLGRHLLFPSPVSAVRPAPEPDPHQPRPAADRRRDHGGRIVRASDRREGRYP
ncbi:hypothetical protein ABH920_007932 [Catenulispora sp. EB89]